jgi:DNA-binding beta-propeller fold protein YncE
MMTVAAAARDHTSGTLPRRRIIGPARAVCRLTMAINDVDYRVEPNARATYAVEKAYRLSKPDGTAYDVASTHHGLTCDCPDFIFHRDGIDPDGCKHIKAMVAYGLLDRKE